MATDPSPNAANTSKGQSHFDLGKLWGKTFYGGEPQPSGRADFRNHISHPRNFYFLGIWSQFGTRLVIGKSDAPYFWLGHFQLHSDIENCISRKLTIPFDHRIHVAWLSLFAPIKPDKNSRETAYQFLQARTSLP